MSNEKNTLEAKLAFIKTLWETGATHVRIEDIEVEFGDRELAEPSRLEDDPLPKTEPGYSFFFEGDFSGVARVNMTDQEAQFVRDLIQEDAVQIVEKYLKRVRYGG